MESKKKELRKDSMRSKKEGMRIVTRHQGTLQHLRKAVETSRAICKKKENRKEKKHIALYNLTESLKPFFIHQTHKEEDVICIGFARE